MNYEVKYIRWFRYSAAALLLITGLAKIISGAGNARILNSPEPLLSVPFRYLFWVVGGIELVVAGNCFFNKKVTVVMMLVAWLTTNFLFYRLGLLWIGYEKPCACLGSMTSAIGISPNVADNVMKVILGYLFIGSYAALIWLWKQNHRFDSTSPAAGTATGSI